MTFFNREHPYAREGDTFITRLVGELMYENEEEAEPREELEDGEDEDQGMCEFACTCTAVHSLTVHIVHNVRTATFLL